MHFLINIDIGDLEGAVAFYRDAFGLRTRGPGLPPRRLALPRRHTINS